MFARRFMISWLIALFLTCICPRTVWSQPTELKNIHTLYLYNLLLFVEWPEFIFDAHPNICIDVIGDLEMYDNLKKLHGKYIRGKRLTVAQIDSVNAMEKFRHVLFIGSAQQTNLDMLLGQVDSQGVLTVSDIKNFAQRGGMIGFILQDSALQGSGNKRFEINLGAVKRANLKIRSRVLRLAHIVYGLSDQ